MSSYDIEVISSECMTISCHFFVHLNDMQRVPPCVCLVDHLLVTYLLVSWSMLSHYGVVFDVLAYLGCATPCSWMMALAPQGVR
jgi:hypothetical protein